MQSQGQRVEGWLRVGCGYVNLAHPLQLRFVWELGFWTSRWELSRELGEKRASEFGQERSNGPPRRACGDLAPQFCGTAAAFLDVSHHETTEMIQ